MAYDDQLDNLKADWLRDCPILGWDHIVQLVDLGILELDAVSDCGVTCGHADAQVR